MENGVSLVAFWIVVRYAHKTPGNSSSHLLFSSSLFFKHWDGLVQNLYMSILPYGYLRVEIRWRTPNSLYQYVTSELVNYSSLSLSDTHFEKWYTATIEYSLFPWAYLRGLTKSIPHCINGHDPIKILSSSACWWFIEVYLWHLLQLWTHLVASCHMVG